MRPAMELGHINRRAMDALAKNDHANAIFLLSQALDRARFFPRRLNEARIRNNLGLAYFLTDRQEQARAEFNTALLLVRDDLGEDNVLFRRIKKNLDKTHAQWTEAA